MEGVIRALGAGRIASESTSSPPLSFTDHRNVRVWVLDTSVLEDHRLADVERALYRVSQQVDAAKAKRTWRSYADAVSVRRAQVRVSLPRL
jgi:hypothetical protein